MSLSCMPHEENITWNDQASFQNCEISFDFPCFITCLSSSQLCILWEQAISFNIFSDREIAKI